MKLINRIVFRKERALIEDICQKFEITEEKLLELLEIRSLNIYGLVKNNHLIKVSLEQLILEPKDINKIEICKAAIRNIILLGSVELN